MTAYAWTLTYDDETTETVRAGTPSRAVARRTRDLLPYKVSSKHLVRGLREAHALRLPMRDRMYDQPEERADYRYPTESGHATWCSAWSPCHDTGVRGRRVQS